VTVHKVKKFLYTAAAVTALVLIGLSRACEAEVQSQSPVSLDQSAVTGEMMRVSVVALDPTGQRLGALAMPAPDVGTRITLPTDVVFDFDSTQLTVAALTRLDAVIATIPSGARVSVDGYTDSLGDAALNLALSEKRAQAVAAVIASKRPDIALTVAGHGSDNPVAANTRPDGSDDPANRALNRRVTLTYTS